MLVLEHAANCGAIQLPVSLRARRSYCRPLARIERAKLNAGMINRHCHRATQRIDLFRKMALADSADRRVAAHLPERIDALRNQKSSRTHPRGSQRGFRTGVTATDHYDVISFCHRVY